jgi:hypothetical protein
MYSRADSRAAGTICAPPVLHAYICVVTLHALGGRCWLHLQGVGQLLMLACATTVPGARCVRDLIAGNRTLESL